MTRRVAFPPLGFLSRVAETYLHALGVETVTPPPTSRRTLDIGVQGSPMKLFYGHVRALVGQVDQLLVPSIQRLAPGSTNCARQIGLPDLLRATMPDLPPLVAPDIDLGQEADRKSVV